MKQYKKQVGKYNVFKRIATSDTDIYCWAGKSELYFVEDGITFDVLFSSHNYKYIKNYMKEYLGLSMPKGRWANG